MPRLQPYRNWSRTELYDHCLRQADQYGFDKDEMYEVIYDKRWNPVCDFDGCSVVQDPIHPFYPCLKHDHDWIVYGGGIEYDMEFYLNLKKTNLVNRKARLWYIGVRTAWLFWYRWKKKNKKKA